MIQQSHQSREKSKNPKGPESMGGASRPCLLFPTLLSAEEEGLRFSVLWVAAKLAGAPPPYRPTPESQIDTIHTRETVDRCLTSVECVSKVRRAVRDRIHTLSDSREANLRFWCGPVRGGAPRQFCCNPEYSRSHFVFD